MKVIALKPGFIHSHYKNEGDEFEVTENEFSHRWMKKVENPETSFSEKDKDLGKKINKKNNTREPIALSEIKPESVLPNQQEVI